MMNEITTIGCYDSGLGGMITVHELHKAYPNLNIVFVADQLNSPYGDKTTKDLCDVTRKVIDKFIEMDIKQIVVACNTLCCGSIPEIKDDYTDVDFITIIEPTYKQLENKGFKSINVLATAKTIDTHVYKKGLSEIYPNAHIREIKATKIVPIIENGYNVGLLKTVVDEYCKDDADAWILGCTHYPLIRPFMNTKGKIYDSIQPVIDLFKDVEIKGEGKVIVYTTKDVDAMENSIKNLLGCEYDVRHIEI